MRILSFQISSSELPLLSILSFYGMADDLYHNIFDSYMEQTNNLITTVFGNRGQIITFIWISFLYISDIFLYFFSKR